MSKWQGFLDSLATKGGNILILVAASSMLLGVSIFVMMKFGPTIPAVVLVSGSYGNFQGALLGALIGKERNGNGTGNGTSSSPAPVAPPTSDPGK